MPETKACKKCGAERPIEEYHHHGRYLSPDCRACCNERSRQYGAENKERRNARLRAWRAKNPDAARRKDRRAKLKSKYGLTEAQVEVLRERFDGACWLCRVRPAVAIDHDHTTGQVRGMTCHPCNSTVIARADADPGFIDRLEDYLENSSTIVGVMTTPWPVRAQSEVATGEAL